MTKNESKPQTVRLNVGGKHYEVSRKTLERCENSKLATLVSDHLKEEESSDEEAFIVDPDKEPIFIDHNGRLFEYVLDYLRTNKVHLPPSVSRAALKEEFEYYGIDADMKFMSEKYDCDYFLEMVEELSAECNQLAAMNAAKKSAQIMKESHSSKREVVFFVILEYLKINPDPGTTLIIPIPEEYRRDCVTPWVREDLSKRGFSIVVGCDACSSYTMKIRRN